MSVRKIIAVSGGSGSGKTTFANLFQQTIGEDQVLILRQDNYYKDVSDQFDYDGGSVNFDHPDSIDFELIRQHLIDLKGGLSVQVPQYDFKTHKRLPESIQTETKPLILFDGTLILSQLSQDSILDIKVFVDTPEEIRFKRRLFRDVRERGRTEEGVRAQFAAHVKPMHDQFVEVSKQHSDYIFKGTEDLNLSIGKLKAELEL